ncbi:unnamed protein product [Dicrocoelium dendriticum]|nr:unnamed protein product [Dicrocoelium dendriticum]
MSDVEDDFGVPPRDSSVRLTDAQRESVLHLQEISGSLNHDAAADILKDCDWDLARAVNRFFGLPDQSQDTSVTRRIHAQTSTLPPVSLVPANQRTLRITESRTSTWWWAFSLLLEPIRLTYHLLFGLARLFVSFLWPDPRTNVTDPVGDVRRFIDHYESAFAQCSLKPADPATLPDTSRGSSLRSPPFFVGSYAEALREAKRTLRFLVVYLHMDSHEDTRKFCHKTLQNEEVIQFLNNSEQLLFWGCNINSPEGYRVSKTLRSHAYPFIGVVGLSNLPAPDSIPYPSTMTGLALLGRIEGAVKPQDLIQQLNSILNDHQDATLSARLDRSEREAAARIREEQDLAYQQSLAQDRAKLAAKEAELRTAAEEASQLAEARRHEEALRMAVSARRLRWRSRLPPAPEAGSPNTVQLSIKMPNGNRVSRVFSITDSVKAGTDRVYTIDLNRMGL